MQQLYKVLISTKGGLFFINFIRKLMKIKKYPENPVYPVEINIV